MEAVRVALGRAEPTDTGSAELLGASHVRPAPSLGYADVVTQKEVTASRTRAVRERALEQAVNRFNVEWHKKLAIAFACLVFTLLGPPLALRFPRGGVGLVVTASSVIFSVYWVGLIAGESLADRRIADPAVTMWASNVIFLAAGIVLVAFMGRTGGHTRGGSVDELWHGLLTRFRRSGPGRAASEAGS